MTENHSSFLRLYQDETVASSCDSTVPSKEVLGLCRAFAKTTGWEMKFVRTADEVPDAHWKKAISANDTTNEQFLAICPPGPHHTPFRNTATPQAELTELADSIGELLIELEKQKQALWEREAELAAGVPVIQHDDEVTHLAVRLETILASGAEAVGCQAASLYLLDDATSSLKMRACWGLPKERLLVPPRPLRGAVADLEALVGHAVAIEDTTLLPHWKVPENFPSAVCVPVSSPTIPLGTLWFFSDDFRDFSEKETNVIEIIAGRLAADLEREMLLTESSQTREFDRQFCRATCWLENRLPSFPPLLEDWDITGWTLPGSRVGGAFYDWMVLPDASVGVAVGHSDDHSFEGALSCAALQSSVKAHTGYRHTAAEMLARVNETIWTSSDGDQPSSLFYGMLQPESGEFEWALGGTVRGWILRNGTSLEALPNNQEWIGSAPDSLFPVQQTVLGQNDALIILGSQQNEPSIFNKEPLTDTTIKGLISEGFTTAQDILDGVARSFLEESCPTNCDTTILVVRGKSV